MRAIDHQLFFDVPAADGPLLVVRNIVSEYPAPRRIGILKERPVRVLSDLSFDLARGEIVGIIGESGVGKSTLTRALFQIPRPRSGSIIFEGKDLTRLRKLELRVYRRRMQLVMQDPIDSLNPTWRVMRLVEEPLLALGVHNMALRRQKVAYVLDCVGLPISEFGERHPRELSGGQCQRVAIARALVASPTLLVLDEALSALDAILQAQLADLLHTLRNELRLAVLFISHDLPMVRHLSDRILTLRDGQLHNASKNDSIDTLSLSLRNATDEELPAV